MAVGFHVAEASPRMARLLLAERLVFVWAQMQLIHEVHFAHDEVPYEGLLRQVLALLCVCEGGRSFFRWFG